MVCVRALYAIQFPCHLPEIMVDIADGVCESGSDVDTIDLNITTLILKVHLIDALVHSFLTFWPEFHIYTCICFSKAYRFTSHGQGA